MPSSSLSLPQSSLPRAFIGYAGIALTLYVQALLEALSCSAIIHHLVSNAPLAVQMEQTAHLPRNFALRVMSALVFLATVDFIGLSICIRRIVESGPSMAILFANEVGSLNSPSPSTRPPLTKAPSKGPSQRHSSSKRACLTRLRSQKFALMIVTLLSTGTRFILNLKDIQGEAPWEHRSVFLFYFEFLIDSLKLIVYSIFFATVVIYYGIPLHIIRDLYLTVHSFVTRIRDIIRYRRATANMHEQYADATEEDLASTDRICIICREEMATSIKKLACGHLFHFNCLRSWLERQQTCPTCRSAIAPPPNGNEDGRNPDPPNQHHQMANGDAGEGEVVGARQRRSLDGGLAAAMRRGQVRQRSLPPNGAPVEEASVRGRHYTAYSTYPGNYEASPVAPPIIFVRPDQIVMEGDEGGTDAIYRLKSVRAPSIELRPSPPPLAVKKSPIDSECTSAKAAGSNHPHATQQRAVGQGRVGGKPAVDPLRGRA